MIKSIFPISFWAIFLCLSCTKESISPTEIPPVLRLGYRPPEENIGEETQKLHEFAKYLEQKLEMPVQLLEILGYAPAIEALRSNKIEITNLGSFGFVIAEDKAEVEPLAFKGHKGTGKGMYYSYCLTSNPKINSMEDVKRLAPALKLTFGNPASTSGHLIPKKYLATMGIYPENFKEVMHSPDHVSSLMAVLTGNVDVGVIQNTTVDKFIKTGKIKKEDIKILFQSDPIQEGPYVIRKNLPEDFKKKGAASPHRCLYRSTKGMGRDSVNFGYEYCAFTGQTRIMG